MGLSTGNVFLIYLIWFVVCFGFAAFLLKKSS